MSSVARTGSSTLSIAILGAGAIGSTFAYYLARAGHSVTAVARPGSPRLRQLQRDQAIALTTGERAAVRVADRLDEQVPYDVVIVTTLAHQVDTVLPSLRRSQAQAIHFLFNTFEPDRLQAEAGRDRCSFGMPFVMSILDEEGRLKATISSSRKTLHGDQRWVEVFNGAGIASAYEANMPLWLRCHVPFCIAMESISCAAQRRGQGATWAEARKVGRGMHAAFRIVQELGYPLYPSAKKLLGAAPDFLLAGMLWSLSKNKAFRELLATGVNECRALIGVLLEASSGVKSISSENIQSLVAIRPPVKP